MECGDYGGLQRWQLTIIHLSFGERKLYLLKDLKALQTVQGFFHTENYMDLIYECAAKFILLEQYEYKFIVSKNRKTWEIILNFCDSDFFHLAGLHHLTDISIPRNRKETLKNIIEKKKITDSLLYKSRFFTNPEPDKNIKSRIEELRFLEEYLDTDNMIRIYSTRNMKYLHSYITADYIIESQFKGSQDIVYIFLKQREENPDAYCVTSFFKKDTVTYSGDSLYWMLKEKISFNDCITLYQHPNYNKPSS